MTCRIYYGFNSLRSALTCDSCSQMGQTIKLAQGGERNEWRKEQERRREGRKKEGRREGWKEERKAYCWEQSRTRVICVILYPEREKAVICVFFFFQKMMGRYFLSYTNQWGAFLTPLFAFYSLLSHFSSWARRMLYESERVWGLPT